MTKTSKPAVDIRVPTPKETIERENHQIETLKQYLKDANTRKHRAEWEMVQGIFGEIDNWEPRQKKPKTFSMWAVRDTFGYNWCREDPGEEWANLQGFEKDIYTSVCKAIGFTVPIKLKMFEKARVWFMPSKKGIKVKVTNRQVCARWGTGKEGHHEVIPLNEVGEPWGVE